MKLGGGCHCGSVRYELESSAARHGLCHCRDCQRATGAPAVSWALIPRDQVAITGSPTAYESSPGTQRQFCGQCGTSLFYLNATIFPGLIDIQSATLDDPNALPLGAQIQTAERLNWMAHLNDLPSFERYPEA